MVSFRKHPKTPNVAIESDKALVHDLGQGVRLLRLGVAEPNPEALRFWTRVGFCEEKWVGPLEQGLLTYRVLRMSKPLG